MTKRTVSKTLSARVAAVVAEGEAAAAQYLDDLVADGIDAEVRRMLDRRLEDRVAILLGMRRATFGSGWEIDTMRKASPILVALEERVKAAATAWVDAALAKPVKLSKADADAIRENYIDEIVRRANSKMEDAAADYAEGLVADLLNSLGGDE